MFFGTTLMVNAGPYIVLLLKWRKKYKKEGGLPYEKMIQLNTMRIIGLSVISHTIICVVLTFLLYIGIKVITIFIQ